jgi:hypothetical protein
MDIHRASAVMTNYENTRFVKYIIIQILRDYANYSDNLIDDAIVDEIQRRLL